MTAAHQEGIFLILHLKKFGVLPEKSFKDIFVSECPVLYEMF